MSTADELLNEQILEGMREAGDDLSTVRPVHFQFVFPSQELALGFADAAVRRGVTARVSEVVDRPVPELPWNVDVTIKLRPELNSISRQERHLGRLASHYRGLSDGWFCQRFTQDQG